MVTSPLSVREILESDIGLIADYWTHSEPSHLVGMGVDLAKIPPREDFVEMLTNQLRLPLNERQSYGTVWESDGRILGHCNVNRIQFGHEAYMHLHIWHPKDRYQGLGATLVPQSLVYFFDKLELQELYCEPYALNPAPSKVLAKVGFEFIKEHTCVPGPITFEQKVSLWHMSRVRFQTLNQT